MVSMTDNRTEEVEPKQSRCSNNDTDNNDDKDNNNYYNNCHLVGVTRDDP